MTTIFPQNCDVNTASAGAHVLIIGVGGYPYQLDDDGSQLVDGSIVLSQLSSPPVSAQAIADWFLEGQGQDGVSHGFHNPKAPLASIEMLVSPPCRKNHETQPHKSKLAGAGEVIVEGATQGQILTGYRTWLERVAANPDSIGVFYFCGHGVTGLNDYLLPEDFGQDRLNPWIKAIDIGTTARAARRTVAGALYFLIDACRQTNRDPLKAGAPPQALHTVNFEQPVQCFSRLILWATGQGMQAHGAKGKSSRFTSALIKALSGFYGEPSPDGPGWIVSGAALARTVDEIMEQDNKSRDPRRHQHMEVQRIGSHPFHYETVRPRTVAATVSIAPVNLHVRQVLELISGSEKLSPMVKETIAEEAESGRLAVEALQQEVNRWSQDLAEWAKRLAAEPDRAVAERASELLAAGKLDEAGALFDQLILAAEGRAVAEQGRLVSYYATRADVLSRQLQWREAVPFLEKAIAGSKQIYGDTPHPDVADHLSSLGLAWHHLAKYQRAIDCYTQVLQIDKRVHGDTPVRKVADHLTNMGLAWFALGEYRKAIEFYRQALQIDNQVYGDAPQPAIASHLSNLGEAWHDLGEYHKAIDFYKQALQIDKRVYGDTPQPDMAIHLSNLGRAWHVLGEDHKAMDFYTQALQIDKQVYGDTPHPDVATHLSNLGLAWHHLGKYHKAIDFYKQALQINKQVYGDTPHPNVAALLNSLGGAWHALGDDHKAMDFYKRALEIDRQVYGDTPHPAVAAHLSNLGGARHSLGEHDKAIDLYAQALGVYLATLPKDHRCITITRANLALAQRAQAYSKK